MYGTGKTLDFFLLIIFIIQRLKKIKQAVFQQPAFKKNYKICNEIIFHLSPTAGFSYSIFKLNIKVPGVAISF